MDTGDFGLLVVIVACASAFVYKLRHLRRLQARESVLDAPGRALRALVAVLGSLAAALVLILHVVQDTVDGLIGLPGVTRLASNFLNMVAGLAVVAWLLYLSRPEEEARARVAVFVRVYAAVIAVSVVLFAVDHPPLGPGYRLAGAAMYPYLLWDLYIVASLFLVAWRYAAIVEAPMMRLGLRMISGTCVCAVGFTSIDLVYLLDGDLHLGIPGSPDIEKPLYTIGAILFITGVTLPAFGPRLGLEELWWSFTRRRLMRQMRGVWKLVTDAYPSVVLNRDLLAVAPHGRRLAAERLPVEVHDAWLQLRHYLTTADVEAIDDLARQRGLTGDDHAALIAAGRLMVALQRKNANAGPSPTATAPVEHLGTGAHRTLAAEAQFLGEVSKAIKSPFVRDVLRARVTAWSLTGQ